LTNGLEPIALTSPTSDVDKSLGIAPISYALMEIFLFKSISCLHLSRQNQGSTFLMMQVSKMDSNFETGLEMSRISNLGSKMTEFHKDIKRGTEPNFITYDKSDNVRKVYRSTVPPLQISMAHKVKEFLCYVPPVSLQREDKIGGFR
jgi:hypothetical protein